MEKPTFFPCWGHHQRMGHTSIVGYFWEDSETTLVYQVPAVEGDATREPTEEAVGMVPRAGPAFFGFDRLTEENALAVIRAARPRRGYALLTAETVVDDDDLPY